MEEVKNRNKWLTLIVVAVTGFLVLMDMTIVNITFPQLTKLFNVDASVVLWITLSYALVSTGLTPVFGRLGDMVGRKKIYLTGLIIFTVGLVVASFSQSIVQLILARVIQGVGSSIHMALAFAIVTDAFPENQRGKALGINGSIFSIGPILGPALGGILVDTLGWQAIFYVQIPVALAAIIMAIIFLSDSQAPDKKARLDLWGAATIFLSLSFFTLFLNFGGRQGFGSPLVLGMAAACIVAIILFVIQEKRTEQPVLTFGLFKIWNFVTGNISMCIMGMAASFHALLFPFFLVDGAGYSSSMAGLFLTAVPIVTITVAPAVGTISDKIGTRWLSAAGTTILCIALLLSSRLTSDAGVVEIFILIGLFGLGAGLFTTPNTSQVMGALPKDSLGTGSAMMNTLRQIGSSSGTAVAGLVYTVQQAVYYSRYAADYTDQAMLGRVSVVGGFHDALLVASAIAFISIIACVASKNKKAEL